MRVRGIFLGLVIVGLSCGDNGSGGSGADAGSGINPVSGDGSGSADGSTSASSDDGGSCGGNGSVDFSYIWIANSPEGTVSKIDTETALEVGRYFTGADPGTDPSRTSVNLDGDVAVLNRRGGVIKIAAIEERCVDTSGDGTIQTSSGPGDVLPWGQDECVLWSQETGFVPDANGGNQWGPRPIAWDAGFLVPDGGCERFGERLWIGWFSGTDTNIGVFRRLDGDTGATLDEVEVTEWGEVPLPAIRPYGGATNREGDFWILGKHNQLVRIDAETLEYEKHYGVGLIEFYGLALDDEGRPWIGSCSDGDVWYLSDDKQFESLGGLQGCARGIQIDEDGRGWLAGNDPCRLVQIDTKNRSVIDDNIALPGCQTPVGVSIDVEGFVWVVDKDASLAYKVDPDTRAVAATVDTLSSPYTYSDMTGAGLRLVHLPEE